MAESADAIDLGSISKEWEFKSLHPHQIRIKRTLMKIQSSFFLFKQAERAPFGVSAYFIQEIIRNSFTTENGFSYKKQFFLTKNNVFNKLKNAYPRAIIMVIYSKGGFMKCINILRRCLAPKKF